MQETHGVSKLFRNPSRLAQVVDELAAALDKCRAEAIVAVEGRDFIAASILAYNTSKPLVMFRRGKKLPTDANITKVSCPKSGMAMHTDALPESTQRVFLLGSDLPGEEKAKFAVSMLEKDFGVQITTASSLRDLVETQEEAATKAVAVEAATVTLEELRKALRIVLDFPIAGIRYQDISPILKTPSLFRSLVYHLFEQYKAMDLDGLILIESRGFLFAPLAHFLRVPMLCIHKEGKLKEENIARRAIQLEYGEDVLEMCGSETLFKRAMIFDDLVATGGTMVGALHLASQAGHKVIGFGTFLELEGLQGGLKLKTETGLDLTTLLKL